MVEVLTLSTLQHQTPDSRRRDVIRMLTRQLDMQFDFELHADGLNERLSDAGFVGTNSETLALILAKYFPFLMNPMALIEKAGTFEDLVILILQKAGNL